MEVTSPREDPAPPVLPAAALAPSVSLPELLQHSGFPLCRQGTGVAQSVALHTSGTSINAPYMKWVGVRIGGGGVSREEEIK